MAPAGTYTFANNKGGSGKSTLAYQLACSLASRRPDCRVLVVDLSLYSDVTTMLMGGTSRPSMLAASRGAQAAMEVTTAESRTEGLLRALATGKQGGMSAAGSPISGLFGGWNPFSPSKQRAQQVKADLSGESVIDVTKFALCPADYQPEGCAFELPSNLYLCCSCGELPLEEDEVPDAIRRLDAALATLASDWVVLFDTDHLARSPVSELALCCADKLVLPLSIDDNDFSRLFIDPTGNALFDVLEGLEARQDEQGGGRAKVHKVVFNNVLHYQNAPSTAEGIKLPFTASKTCTQQMRNMADQMFSCFQADQKLPRFFVGGEAVAQGGLQDALARFRSRYFTGMRKASETVTNASKLLGCPICRLPSGPLQIDALTCQVDAKTLSALQAELEILTDYIFS